MTVSREKETKLPGSGEPRVPRNGQQIRERSIRVRVRVRCSFSGLFGGKEGRGGERTLGRQYAGWAIRRFSVRFFRPPPRFFPSTLLSDDGRVDGRPRFPPRPAPPELFYINFFLGFFTRLFGQGTDAPSRKKKFNTYIAGRLCPTTDDRRRRASLLFLAPERWDVSKRKIKRSYKLRGFYNFRSGRIRSTESTPLDEIDIVPRSSPPPALLRWSSPPLPPAASPSPLPTAPNLLNQRNIRAPHLLMNQLVRRPPSSATTPGLS